mmetsp:Transcript_96596/g.273082  ORF Transcript_96596/g.273082 Transcript_96596/m.273082 type:complete len:108 (-) Transcript_96596:77-400(-)
MGPKVQQKTKEQKLAAALAGAKSKKKKWSKGKMREKLNSKVLFDEDGWLRLQAEVPKMKLITPSALVERLKINASLARAACKHLVEEGKIALVEAHHGQQIYTRVAV